MKRTWITTLTAVLVATVMIASQTSVVVQAAPIVSESGMMLAADNGTEKDSNGDGVTDNGFKYASIGGSLTITQYFGTATALTVPQKIEVAAGGSAGVAAGTYDVTAIDRRAFAGNAGLTSVTMQGASTGTGSGGATSSAGLQKIGDQAFYGCPSLTTVTIPATVTDIGTQAFSDCPALTALNVTAGNQRYVSNDGVLYEYIGINQSSSGYNTYTLLQYPSGKQESVFTPPAAIANRLTMIGEGAFSGAQALAAITLPESVESIQTAAFSNCSALTSIAIPSKVTVIPKSAFSGCSSLTNATMADNVVSIGAGAFENCYALESITLPSKLTAVDANTFYGCSKLTEIEIPSNVKSIGTMAFAYCDNLVKITVPSSVTAIGANAFMGVNGLTMYCHSGSHAANYAASNKIGTVMTYTVRFLSDTGTLLSSQEVVYGSAAKAPDMPQRPGYKLTWSSSFSNVSSDLTVTAGYTRVYTVTFIDKYRGKTSAVQVEYGKAAKAPAWTMTGYTLKWSRSFSNVTSDLTVYASWKDPKTGFVIDKDTIKPAKVDAELKKGTVTYRVTSSNVQNPKVTYVSNSNKTARTISIPATATIDGVKYKVTGIDDNAFKGNTKLTTLTIGSNVTSIGSKAFYKCKNLSKVKISSKKLSTIGSKAFYGIKNNAIFYAYRSKLTSYQPKIKKSGINTTIRLKAIS